MGLYYNPPQPNIGNRQPLQQPLLDPPQSGPSPQNPQFLGSVVNAAILVCWALSSPLPQLPAKVVPQSAPTTFVQPTKLSQEIYRSWEIAAPLPQRATLLTPQSGPSPLSFGGRLIPITLPDPAQAPVARNLNPPISGPAPTAPPTLGATIPVPVQVAWIPPPPAPIVAINLIPPIGGPTPQPPPIIGASVPAPILVAWLPPYVAPITPRLVIPQSAPVAAPVLPTKLPIAIQIAWQIAPFAPIVASNITPPSGPVSQLSFGARLVPIALPDFTSFIVARNLNPPISGPAAVPVFPSALSLAVQDAWLPQPPAPITANNLNPALLSQASFISASGGLQPTFVPDPPLPFMGVRTVPISGPTPQNPPFAGGARVGADVLIGWLPPVPAPIVGPKFTPGISVASNPPFAGGARIGADVLVNWLPSAPAPIVGAKFTSGAIVNNPPFTGGSRVPLEVQIGWIPSVPLPLVAINLKPPISGPITAFPFIGSAIPAPIPAWWVATPQPQSRQAFFIAPTVSFPFTGTRVSREILQSWESAQQPAFLSKGLRVSGPTPSNPPLGGGALIRQSILVAWAPIVPAPIFTASTTIYLATTSTFALRFLDVHGAMPPEEFGADAPSGAKPLTIASTDGSLTVSPTYRRLTDKGVFEN